MKRFLDTFAGLCLFLCGLFVVWISISLWRGPLTGQTIPWRGALVIGAGAVSSLAAVALLFTRRLAAIVGSLALLFLACYYIVMDPVLDWDLLFPALFGVVAVFVFWRFARFHGATPNT